MGYHAPDFPCDQMPQESNVRMKSVGGGLDCVSLFSPWLTVGGCWPQAGKAAVMASEVRKQRE